MCVCGLTCVGPEGDGEGEDGADQPVYTLQVTQTTRPRELQLQRARDAVAQRRCQKRDKLSIPSQASDINRFLQDDHLLNLVTLL